MDTALVETPTTPDAQAPSAPAPETIAPEATGTPAQGGQQPGPAPSAPATPNSADPFDGVSTKVLFDHIRQLEQRLQSQQAQPAPAPATPDPLDALLAEAEKDGEFGERGSKLIKALADQVKALRQPPAQSNQPDNANPMPSIEQVVAQAKTEALVNRWYADKAAKNPEIAAAYGTPQSRAGNPILQMQAQQHLQVSSIVQTIANQFGFKCSEDKCLDLGHDILQVLTGKRDSLPPAAAVQQVRAEMVARNNQRTIPPSASSHGAAQEKAMTRDDAIAAIAGLVRK